MATLSQKVRQIIGDSFGASIVEENIEKALKGVQERAAKPEAIFFDPMSMFLGREWLIKSASALSFNDLRNMAMNPIIGSIIQTRISQIAAFMRPQQTAYDFGFQIISNDPEAKKDTKRIEELTTFVYQCGVRNYGEVLLETLARKYMRDSLTLDQACAEVVFRRNGKPAYLVALDAASIRRLKASLVHNSDADSSEDHYVQILNDAVVARFTNRQMMFGIRNPQTNLHSLGYGMSELEMLIRTVTTILNTERYNQGQLTQGGIQKGILVVKGDADRNQMETFKRDFREAIRNASAFWRPPVLQVSKESDIDWVKLDQSNRDMEYAQLFDFLVKQACGVYQIDPQEINWQIGATGQRTTFESSKSPKIAASKEKGLKPLLVFFANQLNVNLLQRIDDRYRIEFVGMDQDRKTDVGIRVEEVTNFKMLNEIRTELGLEEIEGGDIILNDIWAEQMMGEGDDDEERKLKGRPRGKPKKKPKKKDDDDEVNINDELFT